MSHVQIYLKLLTLGLEKQKVTSSVLTLRCLPQNWHLIFGNIFVIVLLSTCHLYTGFMEKIPGLGYKRLVAVQTCNIQNTVLTQLIT